MATQTVSAVFNNSFNRTDVDGYMEYTGSLTLQNAARVTNVTLVFNTIKSAAGSHTEAPAVYLNSLSGNIWTNSNGPWVYASISTTGTKVTLSYDISDVKLATNTIYEVQISRWDVYDIRSSGAGTCTVSLTYEEAAAPDPVVSYTASTGTLNKTSVPMDGSSITMSISASSSSLRHEVVWACGSASSTSSVAAGVSSCTFNVPTSWNSQFTNSESGTATATLRTYDGNTLIGSAKTYNFTVTVPTSAAYFPSVTGSITAVALEPTTTTQMSAYIQNRSRVKISITGTSPGSDATIKSYQFSGQNMSVTVTADNTGNASATSEVIAASGSQTYRCVITDSRNRTTSVQVTINVNAYSPPFFIVANAAKVEDNTSTTPLETGTYLYAYAEIGFSSVNNQNTATWSWQFSTDGTAWNTEDIVATELTSGQGSWSSGGKTANAYYIKFTATDTFGSSTSLIINATLSNITMFFKKGGNGIGIGAEVTKTDENVKALEVASDWQMYWGTTQVNNVATDVRIPGIIVSQTAPSPRIGLIWLEPIS